MLVYPQNTGYSCRWFRDPANVDVVFKLQKAAVKAVKAAN